MKTRVVINSIIISQSINAVPMINEVCSSHQYQSESRISLSQLMNSFTEIWTRGQNLTFHYHYDLATRNRWYFIWINPLTDWPSQLLRTMNHNMVQSEEELKCNDVYLIKLLEWMWLNAPSNWIENDIVGNMIHFSIFFHICDLNEKETMMTSEKLAFEHWTIINQRIWTEQ